MTEVKPTAAEQYPKSQTALDEERILAFWDQAQTFRRSLEKDAPQGEYVFYDGPPFGTGEPHYGHILSSVTKDVVPRYWTMRGYRVNRRWGWDCHGLPIENIIEADLKISGKKQIEEMGVAKFNEACRARVLEYAGIWDVMVRRIARWVDFQNSYKTMDKTFMESVWWGFKEMWNKDLVYQGRRVLLYCPRCETPISNFEVAMDNSYRDITEKSVFIKFKIKNSKFKIKDNTYILAWTTTPWTLPGNVALAVGKEIDYVLLKTGGEHLILAKERLEVIDGEYVVVGEMKGSELVGVEYEPLFDVPSIASSGKPAYYVAAGDFVTTADGTGVVHTAVMYGEDDFRLGLELDLPVVPSLDEKGIFNDTVPQFTGTYFKKADPLIIADLESRGLLYRAADHLHSYPHCHRCNTQLFYNAIPAWFIAIDKLRARMVANNEKVSWYPAHLKHGRFKQGIEQAPDWNISRNRYFATPMPVWRCDRCGQDTVIGSVKELEAKAGTIMIMRHGEAVYNAKDTITCALDIGNHLTDKGKAQVAATIEKLRPLGITRIVASDLERTKETAERVGEALGVAVEFDERLREVNVGEYEGKRHAEIDDFLGRWAKGEDITFPNGESWADLVVRVQSFYRDVLPRYGNERLLVVAHGDLLTALEVLLTNGGDWRTGVKAIYADRYIQKAEVRDLPRRIVDLHSHFVDPIVWPCACGGTVKRISEVFDCWVESGSMSFAQHHYPFENKERFESTFPAQFISEYISQTRAWFYVMHVISTALFDSNSFEHCVTNGVILNEKGEKMSKSKKNYPDAWKVINEFGVDALRFYLMSASLMHAENLYFSERDLRDVFRKNGMLLGNVMSFYELFAGETVAPESEPEPKNVLDRWILARLRSLTIEVTAGMDGYDLPRACRPLTAFIDDLSTWYLRRSRDRFKSADAAQRQAALATLSYVLRRFSLLIAPVMPFTAERIWQKVTGFTFGDESRSVHLEEWPVAETPDNGVLEAMAAARRIVELALAKRDEAGIKIRQPLSSLAVTDPAPAPADEYLAIIADELNVKAVNWSKGGETAVTLDTAITPELMIEGLKRELVRTANALRKNAGLTIADRITLSITGGKQSTAVVKRFSDDLKRETLADELTDEAVEGEHRKAVTVDGEVITVVIKKSA